MSPSWKSATTALIFQLHTVRQTILTLWTSATHGTLFACSRTSIRPPAPRARQSRSSYGGDSQPRRVRTRQHLADRAWLALLAALLRHGRWSRVRSPAARRSPAACRRYESDLPRSDTRRAKTAAQPPRSVVPPPFWRTRCVRWPTSPGLRADPDDPARLIVAIAPLHEPQVSRSFTSQRSTPLVDGPVTNLEVHRIPEAGV